MGQVNDGSSSQVALPSTRPEEVVHHGRHVRHQGQRDEGHPEEGEGLGGRRPRHTVKTCKCVVFSEKVTIGGGTIS